MRFINKEFLKFIISGGINTVATYGIYLLLLLLWEYMISYTISYVLGIFLSYYLNTFFVFKEKVTFLKFIKFPVVYLVQYLMNLVILHLLVEYIKLPAEIVPIIVVILTMPITYLLSKYIIKGR
ncbi:GtrA family protein [Paenibacillus crassostreae]|uniref:Polysaccharide synthesis protein GtrA n=2 Tax=Paenibacillus crassostreae TaxID=1763538 RepID=A0A162KWG9_9BACL|nr:GtrA family protein [Paenibacillus crassostreae]AOZ94735.1 polysaccharide synthesis protein GtrA [Paenibacillus crassostreae]OAB75083.1 polysaccharide synthesis protein GtrA [Paenibacillus crassostreae]